MKSLHGIFVERLAVSGPGLPDAVLEFHDGLNVVAGASETGKSYAFRCIDFAFGAGRAPKKITEAEGYQVVSVRLVVRATGDRIVIDRSLAGGEIRLRALAADGQSREEKILSAKHAAENPETLSGQLLVWSGLWGRQVRTNQRGDRRSLSFRDVAHLILINETRLFEERPPQFTGQHATKPVEADVLRLMVTGHESLPVVTLPNKKVIAANKAKQELVGEMLMAAEAEFRTFDVPEIELEKEIGRVEAARNAALEDFDVSRAGTVELEAELAEHGQTLRKTQARAAVVDGLQKRFTLLDAHYRSDLKRLQTIAETGLLLESFGTASCPVCGAAPADHRAGECAPPYRLDDVQQAARTEMAKIESLKADLSRVLGELVTEQTELAEKRRATAVAMEGIRARIDRELMPRIRLSSEMMRAQTDQRDRLLRARTVVEQLRQLRDFESSFTEADTDAPTPSTVATDLTAADLDAFAQEAEALLREWKYPNPGRVVFSETDQDLVIGDQLRTAHGTGVRALTCAAFILALSRHCQHRGLPHPGLVVLDSPLLAYEEPDPAKITEEDHRLRSAGIKEAFYSTLAHGSVGGQIIVFENRDPPAALTGLHSEHFTGSGLGRFGFFPPRGQ